MPARAFRSTDALGPREWNETPARGAERSTRGLEPREWNEMHTGDRAIARLAQAQQGIVTTAQLAEAGIGPRAIEYRVATGRLARVHRGVYRVGPIAAP